MCSFGPWKLGAAVCRCSGRRREELWGFHAGCDSSPVVCRTALIFNCSSLVPPLGGKTVPAMKYLTAPMRVESASSGSTVSDCFPFFFFLPSCCFLFFSPRLDPNKLGQTFLCVFLFLFGCWSQCVVFSFGWMRRQTLVQRAVMCGWPASPCIKAETMEWKTWRLRVT